MAHKNILAGCLFFWLCPLLAQVDSLPISKKDTLQRLPEVLIIDNNYDFNDGIICRYPATQTAINAQPIISLPRHINSFNNLADVLQNGNYLFLKSYGLGGLATPSLRGTGANHTAVVWNGWNLQSSMNGTLDLSLIPESFLDNASVNKTAPSARYGSGAIGGAILLETPTQFNRGFQTLLTAKAGSFKDFYQSAKIAWSDSVFYSQTRLFHHSAVNDFVYTNKNLFGQPKVRQTNAALSQYGILQENAFKISPRQLIETKVWHQNNHREIPPTSAQASSIAFQDDKFTRASAHWQLVNDKTAWHVSSAFFDEQLIYTDASISLADTSRSKSWMNKLETFVYLPNRHQLKFGLNYNRLTAITEAYANTHLQHQIAFYTDYQWTDEKGNYLFNISIREDIVNQQLNPLSGHLKALVKGFEWKDKGIFEFSLDASRNFRLPTFNDLYWQPGGNPDLVAETSWSQEIGIGWREEITNYKRLKVSFFNKNINNLIQWRPVSNIWTPDNIAKVWARGIDAYAHFSKRLDGWILNLDLKYEYTLSTNQKVGDNAQNTLGKQLIYVPIHQGNANLKAWFKSFSFDYSQNFTGARFVTTSNLSEIPAFTYANLGVHFNPKKRQGTDFFIQINNLWNAEYEVVESRPMPRRNYMLGVSLRPLR